jgi:hypothetical protein
MAPCSGTKIAGFTGEDRDVLQIRYEKIRAIDWRYLSILVSPPIKPFISPIASLFLQQKTTSQLTKKKKMAA